MRTSFILVLGLCLVVGCQRELAGGIETAKTTATTQATEQVIEFEGAGGVKLKGTLMIPPGSLSTKYPAVLLIAGSGPTDRDGNQPGFKPDTLKQIAHGLAAAEIATFRFDKRAVAANAANWPKDKDKLGPYFSWDNHVGDAMGAWVAMTTSPFVDHDHCAILGHSEGGTLTLSMAAQAEPLALVLIGTPARPYDVVIHGQLDRKLLLAGEEGRKLLAENDRISKEIKETGQVPSDVPKELKGLYNASVGVFFKQSFGVVPKTLVAAFPGDVLILNGEMDQQVDPKLDAEALYDACKVRKGCELAIIPLASHNLKPVKDSAEPGIDGEIVPDAVEAMQNFLIPRIGGKEPLNETMVR